MLTRAAFVAGLEAEAHRGDVRLFVSKDDGGIGCRQHVAGIFRRGNQATFGLTRFGLTIHRQGGVSLCGVPRSGGTSILWGETRERVRRLGRDHRAIELGPVGIYIGSDF